MEFDLGFKGDSHVRDKQYKHLLCFKNIYLWKWLNNLSWSNQKHQNKELKGYVKLERLDFRRNGIVSWLLEEDIRKGK